MTNPIGTQTNQFSILQYPLNKNYAQPISEVAAHFEIWKRVSGQLCNVHNNYLYRRLLQNLSHNETGALMTQRFDESRKISNLLAKECHAGCTSAISKIVNINSMLFIAADAQKMPQAASIACFDNEIKEIDISLLATAPWNLTSRVPLSCLPAPVYGAGNAVLTHVIDFYRIRYPKAIVSLEATPTSVTYYKKIGFTAGYTDMESRLTEMTLAPKVQINRLAHTILKQLK